MSFLDALLGRRRPVSPGLDRLSALTPAARELETATGFAPTGAGAVCVATTEGGTFTRIQEHLESLLHPDRHVGVPPAELSEDDHGGIWVLVHRRPEEVSQLVSDLRAAMEQLQEGGYAPQLLHASLTFRHPDGRSLALVHLYRYGTFYPFAPEGEDSRDNRLEHHVAEVLGEQLPIETDLTRWTAVRPAPGL
ncbi:hypothetical protein PJ985_01230 [Streptomyces sp. ACA25]|uniref:PspA-associated protein PspAB n=1 Tax=Streptomyces sp. ACA25 TaxID=3022596 RepID=UPI002306DDAC|nr:hypothetical protein [Streptomyces sp. ACA25]MDB1086196.1 hypothetical protein [Streptomyces sp. ACA25]